MKVKLGEREFEVQPLTLGDWKKIEQKVGNINQMVSNPTFKQMSEILFYILHKADSSLTQEQVDDMLIPGSKEYNELVNIALGRDREENPFG